jgi:electron transport complex protein RnfE
MQAYAPPTLYNALGIFIPLIVVNCIVLGRAEAFASKNGVISSVMDALGMGAGFTLALVALGMAREFFCGGSLFDIKIITGWTDEFMILKQAPGAFVVLGLFLAGMNFYNMRKAKKQGVKFTTPVELDCKNCCICKLVEAEKNATAGK